MISIAVIDDESSIRNTLGFILRSERFHPALFSDAQCFLHHILAKNNKHYDLIIADINLEGMDGIDFLKKISAVEPMKYSCVLLLSGLDEDRILNAYREVKDLFLFMDFAEKNIRAEHLLLKIKLLIKLKELYEEVKSLKEKM